MSVLPDVKSPFYCFIPNQLDSNLSVRLGNRTIGVNLRKELVCSRAIHCASYIQRKEAQ